MMRKQVHEATFGEKALLYIEKKYARFDGTKSGVQPLDPRTINGWLDQFMRTGTTNYRLDDRGGKCCRISGAPKRCPILLLV